MDQSRGRSDFQKEAVRGGRMELYYWVGGGGFRSRFGDLELGVL